MQTISLKDFYILKNQVEYIPEFQFELKGMGLKISGYSLICPYTNEKVGNMDLHDIRLNKLCNINSDQYDIVYKN